MPNPKKLRMLIKRVNNIIRISNWGDFWLSIYTRTLRKTISINATRFFMGCMRLETRDQYSFKKKKTIDSLVVVIFFSECSFYDYRHVSV